MDKPLTRFDWVKIRALFEAGTGITSIAKMPEMPSKQAISQRAHKEEWKRVGQLDPLTPSSEVIPFDGLTEEQRYVVQQIADGATQRLAAQMIGHHEVTITRWKENELFVKALLAAKAAKCTTRLRKIHGSTDWRAAGWLLERDPDSRDEYQPPNAAKGMTGNTFNVLGHVSLGIERQDLPIEPSASRP